MLVKSDFQFLFCLTNHDLQIGTEVCHLCSMNSEMSRPAEYAGKMLVSQYVPADPFILQQKCTIRTGSLPSGYVPAVTCTELPGYVGRRYQHTLEAQMIATS